MDEQTIRGIIKEYLQENLTIYMHTTNGDWYNDTKVYVTISLGNEEIAKDYVNIREGK